MPNSDYIIFETQRASEDQWRIVAHYAGAPPQFIDGFKSKEAAEQWIGSSRRANWVKACGWRND
jgi:hypothetical protein